MTAIVIDPLVPARIKPNYFCRNGQLVDPTYQSRCASRINQIMSLCTKEVGSVWGFPGAVTGRSKWRFRHHVSPSCSALVFRLLMNASDSTSGAYCTIEVWNSTDTTLHESRSVWAGTAIGQTVNLVVDEMTTQLAALDATSYADTVVNIYVYTPFTGGGLSSGQITGLLVGATVYEAALPPDTNNGYINQTYAAFQPINATDHSDILVNGSELWRHGASALFSWCCLEDVNSVGGTSSHVPSNNTNSIKNIFDSSITCNDSSLGFRFDISGNRRVSSTSVPCKFAANLGSVGTGDVACRLRDGFTGATLATIVATQPGFGTWFDEDVNIPASTTKIDASIIGDLNGTGTTCLLYAVTLYQYLA